jgi:hypothetical protein
MDMDRFNLKKFNDEEVKEHLSGYNQRQIFSSGELKRIIGTLIGHGMLLERI